jgi:hypothetical protein
MHLHFSHRWLTWISLGALLLYIADRALKMAAVVHFFRRPAPPPFPPGNWPDVALLQPITRGAPDLQHTLDKRVRQTYPGRIHHLPPAQLARGAVKEQR